MKVGFCRFFFNLTVRLNVLDDAGEVILGLERPPVRASRARLMQGRAPDPGRVSLEV